MLQTKKNFWGKRPGFDFGDILHLVVNVGFVAVVYALIAYWSLVPLALILIFLGKWRTLAVRPRFWLPNIKANLVDIIVGVASVTLISQAEYQLVGVVWALLYVGWLLFIKPKNATLFVGVQAFWAQFLGLLALFMVSSLVKMPLAIVVLVWLVAWSSARHYLSDYDEPNYKLLALIWGLLISQMAWFSLHWVQYFVLFKIDIAVFSLIVSIFSASLGSMYYGYKNDSLNKSVVLENSIFAGALLTVVLITAGWVARL